MNFSLILFALLSTQGCSFKKPDDGKKSSQTYLEAESPLVDSDGDGLKNNEDPDPFIADLPLFSGEMMEEIKIKTVFYNRLKNQFSNSELLIKSEDKESVIRPSGNYIKYLVEDVTAYTDRSVNNLVLPLVADNLNLFSAPIISDGVAHNFMAFSSNLEDQGYQIDSVDFEIRNRINIKSERFKNFRDLILDVYYYDYQSKKLEYLDSFKNQGSFEFNKDHLLDIPSIKTRNARIMDNSVLKAGKFLYVKIKDYYIPDLKMNYSNLLTEVKKKSLPFVVGLPDSFEIKYVGINGTPSSFINIVQNGLKDNYEIDENRFIKLKDYPVGEYREDSLNGERINVFSKWHIVTNEINNNPFSYSFLPSDLIVLNYSKSSDPVLFARNVVSTFAQTKNEIFLRGEGLVPLKTRKVRIIISGLTTDEPIFVENIIQRPTCSTGNRNPYGNMIFNNKSVSFRKDSLGSDDTRFDNFIKNTFIEFDGFEYSLKKLLSEKKFSLAVDPEGKIVFDSEDSFVKGIKGFGAESIKFSMFHRTEQRYLETGDYLVKCDCWGAGGGGSGQAGCSASQDRGSQKTDGYPIHYSFFTSLFVF